MPHEKDPQERGALWIKAGAKGEYMSGTIDGEPIVVFRNDRKAPGSKAPDWRILRAKPRETQPSEPPARHAAQADIDDNVPF